MTPPAFGKTCFITDGSPTKAGFSTKKDASASYFVWRITANILRRKLMGFSKAPNPYPYGFKAYYIIEYEMLKVDFWVLY